MGRQKQQISTTECQGFAQKLLKYNILQENIAWPKEGKVALHYRLCLFKATMTRRIEFRPSKSSQVLGVCFPVRCKRGKMNFQCKSFVTPRVPKFVFRAWLKARYQLPYHKTPQLTDLKNPTVAKVEQQSWQLLSTSFLPAVVTTIECLHQIYTTLPLSKQDLDLIQVIIPSQWKPCNLGDDSCLQ